MCTFFYYYTKESSGANRVNFYTISTLFNYALPWRLYFYYIDYFVFGDFGFGVKSLSDLFDFFVKKPLRNASSPFL